jgi:hypothetical protein
MNFHKKNFSFKLAVEYQWIRITHTNNEFLEFTISS